MAPKLPEWCLVSRGKLMYFGGNNNNNKAIIYCAYYIPSTNYCKCFTYIILEELTKALQSGYYYYCPHFTKKEN